MPIWFIFPLISMKKMMIGKDDTGQKRNTYFSFGKSGDETMMSK